MYVFTAGTIRMIITGWETFKTDPMVDTMREYLGLSELCIKRKE